MDLPKVPEFIRTGSEIIVHCEDGLFECRVLDAFYWDSVALTSNLVEKDFEKLAGDWFLLKKEDYGKIWFAFEITSK